MFTRSRVLLFVSAVLLGGLLWVGAKQFGTPPAAADEFTVSGPFTHGNLTVFLLHGPDAERSRPVQGLDEALASKCAIVQEPGSVNELAVENTSAEDDLLLLSSDIVKGGRQDRVLQATMILPPKSGNVPVRSFCVEQSRWRKRGNEANTHFADNPETIGGNELKRAVQLAGSQGEVWRNVAVQQAALTRYVGTTVNSVESPTSLQLALENDKLQAEVSKFREAITARVGTPTGVVGFVTVVNGQVTGAEAFGSHALFRKAWAKAVSAAAVEAVAAKENRTFTEMTTAGVKMFLARAGDEAGESVQLRDQVGLLGGNRDRAALLAQSLTETVTAIDEESGVETVRDVPLADVTVETERAPAINPTRANIVQGVPTRIRPRILEAPEVPWELNKTTHSVPTPARTAVVEYREKGNGAVIHKSFLPR